MNMKCGLQLWEKKTINTQSLPDVDQVIYTQQFALGSLFKSQNGSIWTTDQNQDLKFKLYKAEFTETTGSAYFYNPPLDESNGYIRRLNSSPITILPKTGKIGIVTTTNSGFIGILTVGRKLAGSTNGGSAIVVGQGSSVSSVSLTDAGANYPASVSNQIVSAYNVSGKGENLKLLITTILQEQLLVLDTPLDFGSGYQVGNVVGIQTSTTSKQTGRDATVTITWNIRIEYFISFKCSG